MHREAEATVEENERDAERQEKLDAYAVQRQLEPTRDVGSEQRARAEQDEHPWQSQRAREKLGNESGSKRDREGPDDVLGRHKDDAPRVPGRCSLHETENVCGREVLANTMPVPRSAMIRCVESRV